MPELFDYRFKSVVIVGVLHYFLFEGLDLLTSGELSVDYKIGSLKEGRLLCELFDRITSILKDSLFSINEGNAGDTVNGVHVSGIERSGNLAGG